MTRRPPGRSETPSRRRTGRRSPSLSQATSGTVTDAEPGWSLLGAREAGLWGCGDRLGNGWGEGTLRGAMEGLLKGRKEVLKGRKEVAS